MTEPLPLTHGVDHVGLAVSDLEASSRFFCECLGWHIVGGRPDYPAVFVGDGSVVVTLWQVEDPAACTPFDRRRNAGLFRDGRKGADKAGVEVAGHGFHYDA